MVTLALGSAEVTSSTSFPTRLGFCRSKSPLEESSVTNMNPLTLYSCFFFMPLCLQCLFPLPSNLLPDAVVLLEKGERGDSTCVFWKTDVGTRAAGIIVYPISVCLCTVPGKAFLLIKGWMQRKGLSGENLENLGNGNHPGRWVSRTMLPISWTLNSTLLDPLGNVLWGEGAIQRKKGVGSTHHYLWHF